MRTAETLPSPYVNDTSTDPRPRFAIGHVMLPARDVAQVTRFYERLGMRLVVNMGQMSILELRGGTHIIVRSGTPGGGVLDLIVDDIDQMHADMVDAGASPGSITRGHPHDRFDATDPEGNRLVISSNHAIGVV